MGVITGEGSKTTVKYSVTPEQIKTLIAKDLGINEEELTINFVLSDISDDRHDRYPSYKCTKVDVTHTKK